MNLLPFGASTPCTQTISSGETTSIALSSNVPGSTFSWTVVENGVSGASSGSGTTIAQTLSATSSNPGTATYTITTTSSSGCSGSSFIAVVTVDPSSTLILPPSNVRGFQKYSWSRFCRINVIT